ncbi:hypothetical protein [Cupriavidus agavae]|nr:hypothetical protein [Cupriavidus agavae]
MPHPERPQWWACQHGGVRVLDGEAELAILASGDAFVAQPGREYVVQAVLDSIVVRTIALQRCMHDPDAAGMGEFVALEPGEADWGLRLQARGLYWAHCHHGAMCLQWRDDTMPDGPRTILLQPGMSFAPGAGEDFCVDALLPGASLLCCMRLPEPTPSRQPASWHQAA